MLAANSFGPRGATEDLVWLSVIVFGFPMWPYGKIMENPLLQIFSKFLKQIQEG